MNNEPPVLMLDLSSVVMGNKESYWSGLMGGLALEWLLKRSQSMSQHLPSDVCIFVCPYSVLACWTIRFWLLTKVLDIQKFSSSVYSVLKRPFALGWFSMSPLPRLHHHDITIIVELFFIYVPCQDKVVLSHFNTDKKKRREKSHSLALTLTLTVTLRPDHLATRHCWRLQCTALSLTHQHYAT